MTTFFGLLLLCALSAWYMTGVIWTVQIVHYPLFANVGTEQWARYHAAHSRRMTWVVLGPMVVELASAARLASISNLSLLQHIQLMVGFVLAMGTWAATFLLAVPRHNQLSQGFNAHAIHRLVITNWVRTGLWTAHGLLMAWVVWERLPHSEVLFL